MGASKLLIVRVVAIPQILFLAWLMYLAVADSYLPGNSLKVTEKTLNPHSITCTNKNTILIGNYREALFDKIKVGDQLVNCVGMVFVYRNGNLVESSFGEALAINLATTASVIILGCAVGLPDRILSRPFILRSIVVLEILGGFMLIGCIN